MIEAYSRDATIGGQEQSSACGLLLNSGGTWGARVRVTAGGATQEYTMDRWD